MLTLSLPAPNNKMISRAIFQSFQGRLEWCRKSSLSIVQSNLQKNHNKNLKIGRESKIFVNPAKNQKFSKTFYFETRIFVAMSFSEMIRSSLVNIPISVTEKDSKMKMGVRGRFLFRFCIFSRSPIKIIYLFWFNFTSLVFNSIYILWAYSISEFSPKVDSRYFGPPPPRPLEE